MNQPVNSSTPESPSGLGLRDIFAILNRRKWIMLGTVLIVAAAALLMSLRQEKLYEASAEVLLSRQNLASGLTGVPDPNGGGNLGDRVALTQSRLAGSPVVAARALRALKIKDRSAAELSDSLTVTAQPDTDILVFTITDPDSKLAPALANEYARQAIAYQSQLDNAVIARAQRRVAARLTRLRRDDRDKGVLYKSLVAKQQQLRTIEALQTSNSYLVRRSRDADLAQPMPARSALLGLIVGLVLGIGLAFLREALDSRPRSPEDVAAAFGAPLFARIPEDREAASGAGLAMLVTPGSRSAEAYRVLRSNVDHALRGTQVKTLMVTSAADGEGKSTTVANLALACARTGQRVALVDLDLRKSRLQDYFNLQGRPGIVNATIGQVQLAEACYNVPLRAGTGTTEAGAAAVSTPDIGTLTIVPAGTLPQDPGEFVESTRLKAMIDALADVHDRVLIDATPMLGIGDGVALAGHVDAVMLVGRIGALRTPIAHEVQRLLAGVPAELIGVAVTGVTTRAAQQYGSPASQPVAAPRGSVARADESTARPVADV